MANQTITADANHDDVTGRNAGQHITLNDGATLTINSEPQYTAMSILHSVRCTDGTCLIDGRDVRHLTVAASSSFVVGETITGGTSGASGEIIRIMDATTLKLRSVAGGAFQASETVTGSAVGTTTASAVDTVGTLEILTNFGFPSSNTRQSTITGRGTWLELGASNGAASQTMTHWTENAVDIGAVWVETGSGTGTFDPWVGLGTGQTLSGVSAKAGELGNVFQYDNTSGTITFGDGTNGNIPVSGAIIRVPNVLILTGTSASSPNSTDPNYTQRASFQSNSAMAVDFEIMDLSGMETAFIGCFSVRLNHVAFCGALEFEECSSKPIVYDCGAGCHSAENLDSFNLKNTSAGGDVRRCNFISKSIRGGYIETSADATIADSTFYTHTPGTSGNGLQMQKSPNTVVTNSVAYGYNGFLSSVDSAGAIFTDCRGGQDDSSSTACLYVASSGARVTNFGLASGLTTLASGASLIRAEDAADVEISGVGTPAAPLDCLGMFYPILLTGAGAKAVVSNVNVTNYGVRVVTAQSAGADIRIYNVQGDNTHDVQVYGQNVEIYSYRDGDDQFGTNSSFLPSMTNVYDTAYLSTFQNDNEGAIGIVCTEKAQNPALYEITAGTPVFDSRGAAIFEQGDQIVWTWPRKILGCTGFQNAAPTLYYSSSSQGSLASEFLVEYDIDTGSGYSNTWTIATAANLASLLVSPTAGFGFKVRLTKTGSGTGATSQNVNFVAIRTATNAIAQLEQYNATETVVQIVAPNLPDGTRYQIFDADNNVELANGVATGGFGGFTNFTYTGIAVQIRLRAMFKPTITTAKRFVEEFGVVTATGLTFLPVLEDWQPHNTYGSDGSVFDQSNGGSLSWDAANSLIRFDGTTTTVNGQEVVAWAAWLMTTEVGIQTFRNLVDYTGVGPLELYRIGIEPPVEIINDSANTIVIADAVLERTDAADLINAASGTFHAMPRHNTGLLVASSQANLNAINAALALLGIDVTNINAVVSDNQTQIAGTRADIAAVGGVVVSNALAISDLDTNLTALDVKVTNMQGDVSALGTLGNNILGIVADNKKLLRADINFAASLANFYEEGTTTVLMTKNMTGGTGLGLPVTGIA